MLCGRNTFLCFVCAGVYLYALKVSRNRTGQGGFWAASGCFKGRQKRPAGGIFKVHIFAYFCKKLHIFVKLTVISAKKCAEVHKCLFCNGLYRKNTYLE